MVEKYNTDEALENMSDVLVTLEEKLLVHKRREAIMIEKILKMSKRIVTLEKLLLSLRNFVVKLSQEAVWKQ